MAALSFARGVGEAEAQTAGLFEQIRRRATSRTTPQRVPLADGMQDVLEAAAAAHGCRLQLTPISFFGLLESGAAAIFTAAERSALQQLDDRLNQLFSQDTSSARVLYFRVFYASAPRVRSLRLPIEHVLRFGEPEP